ncbi:energy transducer TonB [Mucilaginibacter gotjawali]|uniref:TonB family protein n=1 Tax=Mucilaginibacter gotjawali TaxID=1550579 RepID=A0A839SAF6_9SPHI|nr:energy transducer TonB [Mucilaginibacter gotjawali]MBB3054806.1 TonB family protein [Mucilaginibacter gotjawali]
MKLFLISALLCAASVCSAQQKIVSISYFKNDGKYVNNKDSADYFRFVSEPDSGTVLFNVTEYYKSGKRKLIGKTPKPDPFYLEGQCATFFESGIRKSTCTYSKGVKTGSEFDFFPNGKPYFQLDYPEKGDMYSDATGNYLIQMNNDSLGNKLVENGNGYFKVFDDGFKTVVEEGGIKNGKRDGVCKGSFDKNNAHFTENYANGILVSGTAVFKDSSISVYKGSRGVPPQYKGGLEAFYKYLGNHIEYPDDARENVIQGVVHLSFVVEKDGRLSEIKVKKGVYPSIDLEALRVMKKCPLWLPGTQYGRPVRVVYEIPISFSLGN